MIDKFMIIYYLNGIEVNRFNIMDLNIVIFLIVVDCIVIVMWGGLLGKFFFYF